MAVVRDLDSRRGVAISGAAINHLYFPKAEVVTVCEFNLRVGENIKPTQYQDREFFIIFIKSLRILKINIEINTTTKKLKE